MSEEQLKAFIEKLKADTNLQEKLKAAADSDAVLAIAKEAGFSISADVLKNAHKSELSDEEMEGVAGGLLFSWGCPPCHNTYRFCEATIVTKE
jgi:predicted ribosomally synthesized peptide with nif11-like leader